MPLFFVVLIVISLYSHVQLSSQSVAPLASREISGIVNHGNSCFISSAIQLLYHIDWFRNHLMELPPSENNIALSLQIVFSELSSSKSRPLHIDKNFLCMLRKEFYQFRIGEKGDSMELIEWFIQKLPEQEKNLFKWRSQDSLLSLRDGKFKVLSEENSLFLKLPLDNRVKTNNIKDMIVSSMCSRVQFESSVGIFLKRTKMIHLPSILMFRILREQHQRGRTKLMSSDVEIPVVLESAIFGIEGYHYTLSGIVCHRNCHYWNHIYTNGKWIKIDDDDVLDLGPTTSKSVKRDSLLIAYRVTPSNRDTPVVNDQLKEFLEANEFISEMVSGGRKMQNTFWELSKRLRSLSLNHPDANSHDLIEIFLNLDI